MIRDFNTEQNVVIPVGQSREVKVGICRTRMKLWVTRGSDWVPTVVSELSKTTYPQMTNIGDREIILPFNSTLDCGRKAI